MSREHLDHCTMGFKFEIACDDCSSGGGHSPGLQFGATAWSNGLCAMGLQPRVGVLHAVVRLPPPRHTSRAFSVHRERYHDLVRINGRATAAQIGSAGRRIQGLACHRLNYGDHKRRGASTHTLRNFSMESATSCQAGLPRLLLYSGQSRSTDLFWAIATCIRSTMPQPWQEPPGSGTGVYSMATP